MFRPAVHPYQRGSSRNDAIADKFGGILGLPTSRLYNRDGKKVRTIVGIINHDDMAKAIESLL